MMSKSIDTYEKMLKKAWRTTWHHKHWWFLGALAGLASTGAVFNNVFKIFVRLQPADKITVDTLENIFPALSWLTAYARNLVLLDGVKLQMHIVISIVFVVITIVIILTAQHLLVGAASAGAKNHPTEQIKKLFNKVHHIHLFRLFAVDAIAFISITILMSLGALTLTLLLGDSYFINLLAYAGVNIIILPIAFIINIILMMMIIHIVCHEDSIGTAFKEACLLIKNHWLVALEYALLIFCINFLASILLLAALLITAGLTGLLFQAMLTAGSFVLMSFATFLGAIIAAIILISFAGALTMFNYSAWTEMSDRLKRYGHIPAIEHGLQRLVSVFNK